MRDMAKAAHAAIATHIEDPTPEELLPLRLRWTPHDDPDGTIPVCLGYEPDGYTPVHLRLSFDLRGRCNGKSANRRISSHHGAGDRDTGVGQCGNGSGH